MPTHHRASRRNRNSATGTTFRPDFPARLNLVCTRTSGLACTTSHGILFEMNLSLNSLCDDVPAGALQALTQHWLDLFRQAGRQVPRLRAVDPLRFAAALKDAWIVDAGEDGRFRFRLCGETLVEWYGFSPKGRSFEEVINPPSLATAVAQARDVMDRSEEHTSELPSLMRISYAVFCW